MPQRCWGLAQSDPNATIDVEADKLLTRVRPFPGPDRGVSVPDTPIMRQCGRLSLLASAAATRMANGLAIRDQWD